MKLSHFIGGGPSAVKNKSRHRSRFPRAGPSSSSPAPPCSRRLTPLVERPVPVRFGRRHGERRRLVVPYLSAAGGGFKSKFAAAGLRSLRKGGHDRPEDAPRPLGAQRSAHTAPAASCRRRRPRKTTDGPRRDEVTLRCVAVSLLHNAAKAPAQFAVYLADRIHARTRVRATGKGYYREEKTVSTWVES